MNITIEELPSNLKSEVIRIGGVCNFYKELAECFEAIFYHHDIETQGDTVIITDELTGYSMLFKECDFFRIQLI